MSKSVFCIVKTPAQANTIVDRLRGSGFLASDISILLPDKDGTRDFAHRAPHQGAGRNGRRSRHRRPRRRRLGWLAGIGALAIPGLGPFIAAGPIMAALSGAAVVGAAAGITGALIGMGIPEFEAKRYEGKIKGGNVLISVHSEDGKETSRAEKIFKDAGAEDISSSGEAAVAKKDR